MRLTFLLLSPTLGMHQYTADLANRMAQRFETSLVTVASFPRDRYGPAVTVRAPVDLSNTGLSAEGMRFWRLGQVKQALAETRPDVVHITGPHLWNLLLVRWLRGRGIPIVHTIHDLDPHHGSPYGRLLHLWNGAIIRWADHIVVHGQVYRKRLLAAGRRPEQVTCTPLMHLFVGYEMGRRLTSEPVNITYEPIVLFFGRQESYKGVDILWAAYQQLRGRLSEAHSELRVKLILAGPGDAYRKRFGDASPDVEWCNHSIGDEEGVALFRRCAVVVLPYRDATQSALVAAAYFFHKPVIVSDVGALPEYVEAGRTGLVVESDEGGGALAEALFKVLTRRGLGESLGRAGRAWYDERRARETRHLVELYQGLAKQ